MDMAAVQSVNITVNITTSSMLLTDDSGSGLGAGLSQLQTSLCLKPSLASSE